MLASLSVGPRPFQTDNRVGGQLFSNDPKGIRTLAGNHGNPHDPKTGGSNSGNIGGNSCATEQPATPADPDLADLLAVWPDLPAAIRAGILALVKAAK